LFTTPSTPYPEVNETLRALLIRPMRPEDWPTVRAIYLEGIATGDATFQTEAPEWEAWDAAHLAACRLIASREDRIVGWAALSLVSSRPVYAGVTEVSIYVASDERGQGIGTRLMEALIASSERAGVWTLQAGIFPENSASLALHQRCGFRVVGRRERLGQMDGRWRDVLLLERRSSVIGVSHDVESLPGAHVSE
jgi:phosphinothricin acetyltransferase